jgi:hypothetical protein
MSSEIDLTGKSNSETIVLPQIVQYIKNQDSTLAVDQDALARLSDDEVFQRYGNTRLARYIRIPLFYELCRRARATKGTNCEKFFAAHGLKYHTEWTFVHRDEEKINEELGFTRPTLPPTPLRQLARDETVVHKDDIDTPFTVVADNLTTGKVDVEYHSPDGDEPLEETHPRVDLIPVADLPKAGEGITTTKTEKEPCYLCGVRKAKIERYETEIERLARIIEGWQKATGSKTVESFQKKEAEKVEKDAKKAKKDAKAKVTAAQATVVPEYRKDKLASSEFAIMQHDRGGWVSIVINKDEALIDARLAELLTKAATKGKAANAKP